MLLIVLSRRQSERPRPPSAADDDPTHTRVHAHTKPRLLSRKHDDDDAHANAYTHTAESRTIAHSKGVCLRGAVPVTTMRSCIRLAAGVGAAEGFMCAMCEHSRESTRSLHDKHTHTHTNRRVSDICAPARELGWWWWFMSVWRCG